MSLNNIFKTLLAFTLLVISPAFAKAFTLDKYAEKSVLADGRWVKISVQQTGMHFIPASTLREWGFSDISKVTVNGYGARRLPDLLQSSTYIDDLPQAKVVRTSAGIYFYAIGPVTRTKAVDDKYVFSINPYTTQGYYYLTDNLTPCDTPTIGTSLSGYNVTDTIQSMVYHKRELVNIGETGHTILGEDFMSQATQRFNLTLTDRLEDTPVWMECSFHAKGASSSRIILSVNDNALSYNSADNINGTSDRYTHSVEAVSRKTFEMTGTTARISLTHSRAGSVTMARLGHIVINYARQLKLDQGCVDFYLHDKGGKLRGTTTAHVWDVTNLNDILSVPTMTEGNDITWQPLASGARHYAAWQEGASLPTPKFVQRIGNQNIHGESVPDMVIFTHNEWISQARRIAALHAREPENLKVLVVDAEDVYNEFSSGAPDANALRKMLKMFWDRSDAGGDRLKHVLIMGRSTFDNRRITSAIAALPYPTLPCWQTDNSISDNTSYTTDDIYAMLADGSGAMQRSDYQCIGVGRMPVTSLSDARNVVDKLYTYVANPINSDWKNRALMVADDGNKGLFMEHTEKMIERAESQPGAERIIWNKVYLDAYQKQNSTFPGARTDMFRALTEGVVWWNYAGHANTTSWTGDGLMTYTDINNLYLKHFPFVAAATCDFLRWDASTTSAAEILYRANSSGIIGAISATRPAYIDANGDLLDKMGNFMFATDDEGMGLPIGEIFRRTKNGSATNGIWSNDNKLRYVLMGDPALRLCVPSNKVKLQSINGKAIDPYNPTLMMAGQEVTIEGHVTTPAGELVEGFTGKIYVTLYDAEYSTTSHGYGGDQGKEVTFEQQGGRLQSIVDKIEDGNFSVKLIIPGEIANNYRPAALNIYAIADDGRDAIGVERNVYVFGYDDNAIVDDEPPVIEEFYINHPSFEESKPVNTTPVAIARISDNRSINISSAGIGHQMLLTIDGRSLTDTPLYYTPASDGTRGGTIAYQFDELTLGQHELKLRVWDTSGNSTTETIKFNVGSNVVPKLYDIYADCNPASVDTRFYLVHDRPDGLITVNIEVFNMLGRPIWSTTMTGMSDLLKSFPTTWNLTDKEGNRVPRGIYLFRATVTDRDGNNSSTETRRLAVTAN